jgi:ABC-2 family transporter protein
MSARHRLWNHLAYVAALLRVNLAGGLARPVFAATSAAMMLANNLILSLLWVIYFADFSSLRGWGFADLALLMGIVAWAFGLTVFLAGGLRDLANTIADGGLDIHLGRPRHPLPGLLLGRSIPAGLGDMRAPSCSGSGSGVPASATCRCCWRSRRRQLSSSAPPSSSPNACPSGCRDPRRCRRSSSTCCC